MALLAKFLFLVTCWGIIVIGCARAFPRAKAAITAGCGAGAITGTIAGIMLLTSLVGDVPFTVIRTLIACCFMLLVANAVSIWYHAGAAAIPFAEPSPGFYRLAPALTTFFYSTLFALLAVTRIPSPAEKGLSLVAAFVLLSLLALWLMVYRTEPRIPAIITMARGSLSLLVVSVLLLVSSSSPRLDLFSPLSMKVMKLIHDLVHQAFESLLVPDHPFFRTDVWEYIGLLFGNSVGFWGGLIIWFLPLAALCLAIAGQPDPSVAHIRQGAMRRKQVAAYFRARRCQLIVPFFAGLILITAVYSSCNPTVEYWDPKPIAIKASPSGEIHIPLKAGDIDLTDGNLHKYSLAVGANKVRFFILQRPGGGLTVVLDACAICQPEGYGQAEGMVICYYCKTLIPVETVGKPGGCNPVPVVFSHDDAAVHLTSQELVRAWVEQVQSAKNVPRGGR